MFRLLHGFSRILNPNSRYIRRVDIFPNEELELYRLGKGEIADRSSEKNQIELTIFKINNCLVIFSFDYALVMKRDRRIGAIHQLPLLASVWGEVKSAFYLGLAE